MSLREAADAARCRVLERLLKEKLGVEVVVDAVPFGIEGIWFTVWGDTTPYLAVASDCINCGAEKAAYGQGFFHEPGEQSYFTLAHELLEIKEHGGWMCLPCARKRNGWGRGRQRDGVPDPSPKPSPAWVD